MTLEAMAPLVFGRVSLARVRRHADWLAARYLHPRERTLAAALPVAKRRVDFIAGRVAAHRALARLGVPSSAYVLPEVEGAAAGAPRVVGAPELSALSSPPALSIAHGGGWAVAVAGRGVRVGVDIEAIEPRHPSFAAEAFAAGELADWARALGRDDEDALVVTVAWCVKEALLKLAQCGLRAPLPTMIPTSIDLQSLRIRTEQLGECRLVLDVDGARALAVVWSTLEEGA